MRCDEIFASHMMPAWQRCQYCQKVELGVRRYFSEEKKAAHHRSRERLAGFERSAFLLEKQQRETAYQQQCGGVRLPSL